MKAWIILPTGLESEIELQPGESALSVGHRYITEAALDLTRVRYQGRLCTMLVDDEGACKALPVNAVATAAYHANCIPGTTWQIRGPVVIFDRVLP